MRYRGVVNRCDLQRTACVERVVECKLSHCWDITGVPLSTNHISGWCSIRYDLVSWVWGNMMTGGKRERVAYVIHNVFFADIAVWLFNLTYIPCYNAEPPGVLLPCALHSGLNLLQHKLQRNVRTACSLQENFRKISTATYAICSADCSLKIQFNSF